MNRQMKSERALLFKQIILLILKDNLLSTIKNKGIQELFQVKIKANPFMILD